MRAGAEDYLARSQECLDEARQIMAIGLLKVSARCAYYAIFHAAEALIFDRTGKAAKTHSGVRADFARLSRSVAQLDGSLLAQAYKYKEAADYDISNEFALTAAIVSELIEQCSEFVDVIEKILLIPK